MFTPRAQRCRKWKDRRTWREALPEARFTNPKYREYFAIQGFLPQVTTNDLLVALVACAVAPRFPPVSGDALNPHLFLREGIPNLFPWDLSLGCAHARTGAYKSIWPCFLSQPQCDINSVRDRELLVWRKAFICPDSGRGDRVHPAA